MANAQACTHKDAIKEVTPSGQGCKECLEQGTQAVQLRECLTCGHVGCCDSSPGKHATAHFHETKHPIMRAFQSGRDWMWCYVDESYVT